LAAEVAVEIESIGHNPIVMQTGRHNQDLASAVAPVGSRDACSTT
jgi:hypothetical protein